MKDTVRFSDPDELARHVYDRAVEPHNDGRERLTLAVLCTLWARDKWRSLHTGSDRQ